MKLRWVAVLGVVLLIAACAQEPTDLKTEKDKINYGIGVSVARNFKQQDMDINIDLVVKGMRDALAGKKLLMSDDELRNTMMAYQQELRQKQMKQRKMAALDNRKEGDTFLAENKKKQGVVTQPSGLQYKILKSAEGKRPTAEDTVEVKYRGTFINGKEFDASGAEAKSFKVAEVISGWREALQLMPVGSKWELFVPPELAYAERGMGQVIMPNTTLTFEVELVGIKPGAAESPKTETPKPEGPGK